MPRRIMNFLALEALEGLAPDYMHGRCSGVGCETFIWSRNARGQHATANQVCSPWHLNQFGCGAVQKRGVETSTLVLRSRRPGVNCESSQHIGTCLGVSRPGASDFFFGRVKKGLQTPARCCGRKPAWTIVAHGGVEPLKGGNALVIALRYFNPLVNYVWGEVSN